MITYLASYPRSGNTMLRVIFKEVFGLRTHSKYDEGARRFAHLARAVGGAPMGGSWPEEKPLHMAATEHYFIKTHEYPEDDERAIVIVRDPRATIVSYWHYLNVIEGQSISLEAVSNGLCAFGEWTAFYAAWQPQNRANTLLLRYEDLLAAPDRCIDKIAGFTSLTPVDKWNDNFSEMNLLDPQFFRVGNNEANFAELPPPLEKLILDRCAPLMAKLGYQTPLSFPT